jgi:hypothetical protein
MVGMAEIRTTRTFGVMAPGWKAAHTAPRLLLLRQNQLNKVIIKMQLGN